jgi:hypothetical protein
MFSFGFETSALFRFRESGSYPFLWLFKGMLYKINEFLDDFFSISLLRAFRLRNQSKVAVLIHPVLQFIEQQLLRTPIQKSGILNIKYQLNFRFNFIYILASPPPASGKIKCDLA